jgi:D-glycero-D-manno-heptose 1,7-bisphosphate phosphatase
VSIPAGGSVALKQWQDEGYLLIIITNQSGSARGYFTWDDLAAIHGRMIEEYRQSGVHFHDLAICPHHPDEGCPCRKPSPYLLLTAAHQYGIDLARSLFIGDAPSDLRMRPRSWLSARIALNRTRKVTSGDREIPS